MEVGVAATGTGRYKVSSPGLLSASRIEVNEFGIFVFASRVLLGADIHNNGDFFFQAPDGAAAPYRQVVVGDMVNDGQVHWDNPQENVTFIGTYTDNGGSFAADSSSVWFDDAVITESGYWVAGDGTVIGIRGDLTNRSTRVAEWDTSLAALKFDADGVGALHDVRLGGGDFSWRELVLAEGESLQLRAEDGSAAELHVDRLVLEGGVGQLAAILGDGTVTLRYNSLRLGFGDAPVLPTQAGGALIAVPEPRAASLLAAVAAAVAASRRRQARRG